MGKVGEGKRKTAKASREKTESGAAETQEAGYPEKDRDKEESGRCQTVKAEEDSVVREKEDVLSSGAGGAAV